MNEHDISRRNFLKGAGVAAGAAAVAGLAGCTSGGAASASAAASASEAEEASASSAEAAEASAAASETAQATPAAATAGGVDEFMAPGVRATATLENAEPIPPVDAPASWTAEVDFVVVGTGGGGLAASLLAVESGASVITIEKEDIPGGATQHANSIGNVAGTGRAQIEAGSAQPEAPYDRAKFLRWIEPQYQFTIDDDLMGNVVEAAGEALDWMQDHYDGLIFQGSYNDKTVAIDHNHKCLAARNITNKFYELGQDAGVDFHLNTACTALVVEGGRVVGVQAQGPEGEVYYRGEKGIILCSGGIGMNPDLMKKYIPSAYYACVCGGPMPFHTGECTRMALGVGAEMCGIDSWNGWESEPDNDTGYWKYFWGIRQLTQLGWLNIDKRGKRCNYYEFDQTYSFDPVFYQYQLPFYQNGQDRARFAVQASRMGHRAYAIFDGKFEDYMWDISNPPGGERRPTVPTDTIPEQDYFDTDWKVEFENALADGRIKQADTLEELAELLGLEPDVVVGAVDAWNKDCEAGEDSTNIVYPASETFLNPIVEPPFYGVKMGARMCLTGAGVRTDADLRVVDSAGKPIPGLYANFTTAGGIIGESKYGGGLQYSSVLGGQGLSWCSGYFAARTALAD